MIFKIVAENEKTTQMRYIPEKGLIEIKRASKGLKNPVKAQKLMERAKSRPYTWCKDCK